MKNNVDIKMCTYMECDKSHYSKGYCSKHYQRLLRHGMVTQSIQDYRPAVIDGDVAKIPLCFNARQGYAKVSIEDAWVQKYNWSKDRRGSSNCVQQQSTEATR